MHSLISLRDQKAAEASGSAMLHAATNSDRANWNSSLQEPRRTKTGRAVHKARPGQQRSTAQSSCAVAPRQDNTAIPPRGTRGEEPRRLRDKGDRDQTGPTPKGHGSARQGSRLTRAHCWPINARSLPEPEGRRPIGVHDFPLMTSERDQGHYGCPPLPSSLAARPLSRAVILALLAPVCPGPSGVGRSAVPRNGRFLLTCKGRNQQKMS